MKKYLILPMLFLLCHCAVKEPLQPSPAPPPAGSVLPLRPSLGTSLQEMQGSVDTVGNRDRLQFKINGPTFRTQSLDLTQIRYLRCWVRGTGISDRMWNQEGFVAVGGQQATLSVPAIPKGANRIVVAEGYDANKKAIPGALLKAVYTSPPRESHVTVVLKWRFVPAGEVMEYLLDQGSSLAGALDAAALQALLDKVIYGNNPVGGNAYAVHPSRIDAGKLATLLQTQAGRLPDPQQENLMVPFAPTPLRVRTPQGQPFQQAIELRLDDPASAALMIPPGTADFLLPPVVAPGTWLATLKMGEQQVQTRVTITKEGQVAWESDPVILAPVLTALSGGNVVSLAPGLVSWWTAEDGQARDVVRNHHGNPLGGLDFRNGILGQAFNFDQIDNQVLIPDFPSLRPAANLTLEAWVQGDNYSESLVTKEPTPASAQNGYGFRQRSNNKFWFVLGREGAGPVAESTTSWLPGQWYHLMGTYDGAQIRLYVNGALEATTATALVVNSTFPLTIGRLNSGILPFKGGIDEVRFYNQVLTPAQIQAAYASRVVTLTGEGFDPVPANNTVRFGAIAGTVLTASSTSLAVLPPAEAVSGTAPVTVTAGGKTSNAVNFSRQPVFTRFSRPSGRSGDVVSISGSSFAPVPAGNTVTFNGVPAVVTAAGASSLTVTVPNGATSGPVRIVTAGGETLSHPFVIGAGQTCQPLKLAFPNLPDGIYILDPNGGLDTDAFDAYCDMTTDGGGWTRMEGAVHGSYFTLANYESFNAANPLANMYSILNQRAFFKNGNTYTYRFMVGNGDEWQEGTVAHRTVWRQDHDPFTQTTNGSDYTYISGEQSVTCGGFNGLHHKIQTAAPLWSVASDVDTNDGVGCWWMQVVPATNYNIGGILEGYGGNNTHQWQTLWLR